MEVVFVRNDSQFDETVKKIIKEVRREEKIEPLYRDQYNRLPVIFLIEGSTLDQIESIIKDRSYPIILAFSSRSDLKIIEKIKKSLDGVFGFLDLTQDYLYNVPLIKNYLIQYFSSDLLSISKLSNDLEKILEFTQSELSKVKEMHDRIVRLRTDNLKGGKISFKFMAGEKSGGEFFDYLDYANEVVIIQTGSNSYLLSSLLISEVENIKLALSNPGKNLAEEVKSFITNIKKVAIENKADLNFLISIINIRNLEIQYFNQGNSQIYIDKKIHQLNESGTLKLKRGDKVFTLSEGTIHNWNLNHPHTELLNYLIKHDQLDTKSFMNEVFFELYRYKEGSFLKYDALMSAIEINYNIIHEVN
jgi:hypothetical protein